MTTPLDKIKALNYDHHRRMTELHMEHVKSGTVAGHIGVDNESYRAVLSLVPPNRKAILNLAQRQAGSGRLLREWLVPNGLIAGIDLYEPLVQQAQAAGLWIALGYVEQLPYEDAMFDLVCSRHVMEHLGDLDQGISEILRVTKQDGDIAHVTPNMDFDNEPAHLNHLNEAEWRKKWEDAGVHVFRAKRHPFNGGEVHITGMKR